MTVHYEETGQTNQPTLLLIHGAGGSSATWFMQLRNLSSDLHVVAVDLNGHGKTPDSGSQSPNATIESYLMDVKEVVDGFDDVILGGHSMGGAIAQLFALKWSNEINGLVLVGTGARLRVTPEIFELLDNNFEGYVEAVSEFMFSDNASRELIAASKAEVRKCNPRVIGRDFELCNAFDVMDKIKDINLPSLIIVGEDDVMTPVKYSKYLADEIANSKLEVIPEAGHSVMLEQPTAMRRAILEWIAGI